MTYKICYWDNEAGAQMERDATPEEAAEIEARKSAPPPVPQQVSFRQAKTQLQLAGMWDSAISAANAIADPTQRIKMVNLLLDSTVYERQRQELIDFAKSALGLTDADIDNLFIQAATL
jgi:hypothetical protein